MEFLHANKELHSNVDIAIIKKIIKLIFMMECNEKVQRFQSIWKKILQSVVYTSGNFQVSVEWEDCGCGG